MVPNKHNFCGGAFDDWREVLLTPDCNGKCQWCIERNGFHPMDRAPVQRLIELLQVDDSNKIILLGGEPMLYPDLGLLIRNLPGKELYITTNGTNFNAAFIKETISSITGINISIHHYNLELNEGITGIGLDIEKLERAIVECRRHNISVRFNCNIIKGQIDSRKECMKYIEWAKECGVDRVRFGELKADKNRFVSLARIWREAFGLNENPYILGCNKDAKIMGVSINFRQMCGLQTECRPRPVNPKTVNEKLVLYYDGQYYTGWQSQRR